MLQVVRSFAIIILGLFISIEAAAQFPVQRSHLVEIGVADSLYSDVLGEQRQIWVHLPNGGNLQKDHRYPVIYLLDGEVHLGGLAMVQEYYNHFRLPEMIVVGISNRINRTRDLTTSAVETRDGVSIAASGGAGMFTRFIAEELMPYIDSTYPTSSHRTLIGHSYAGLFTINTLVHHRDLFTNYVAIDPSLGWDNQKLLSEATAAFEEKDFSGKGLFVSVANELIRFSETMTIDDVMQDTTEFSLGIRSILSFVHMAEANNTNGLRFTWNYYEKDIHGSVPLISMRDGLIFLYDWWELKSPSRYNDPGSSTEELVSLIRNRTEVLTTNMGYAVFMQEELLNMLGYMAMDMEQPEKAHAIFKLLIEYYPESASAHSAMADFYESKNDYENALLHTRRALDISGSDEYQHRVEALLRRR